MNLTLKVTFIKISERETDSRREKFEGWAFANLMWMLVSLFFATKL